MPVLALAWLPAAARRFVAGGTNVGVDTVDGVGDGTDWNLTVYGRVPTQTMPAPATCVDTVMATGAS